MLFELEPDEEYEKLSENTIKKLQKMLKTEGLDVNGTKNDLVTRLYNHRRGKTEHTNTTKMNQTVIPDSTQQ
jgi:hypothetical protein